jgi:hypothetical protein
MGQMRTGEIVPLSKLCQMSSLQDTDIWISDLADTHKRQRQVTAFIAL